MYNEYEVVVIFRPDLDDAATLGVVEKFEGSIGAEGGHILQRDNWGKRKLAYPVAKHVRGHYVLMTILAKPGTIAEFERQLRYADECLRFMTVRKGVILDVEARLAQATPATAAPPQDDEDQDDNTDEVPV